MLLHSVHYKVCSLILYMMKQLHHVSYDIILYYILPHMMKQLPHIIHVVIHIIIIQHRLEK